MRVFRIVVGLGVVAPFVMVALSLELRSAWGLWWSGASVGDSPLWGNEMAFWGRLGKGLQFLAGLVVVIDLLSPNKLRARGAAARRELALKKARWRRQKTATRVERIREDLERILDFSRGRPADKEQWAAKVDDNAVKTLPGFPEDDLKAWIRGTRTEMNPENWTVRTTVGGRTAARAYMALDGHDQAIVDRRAGTFLHTHLTSYQYAAWRSLGPHVQRHRMVAFLVWSAVTLAIPVIPLFTGTLGYGFHPDDPIPLPVMLLSAATLLLAVFALLGVADLFTARLTRLPRIAFYTTIAAILDSARPGHTLRWIALVLFINGSQFDLLMS